MLKCTFEKLKNFHWLIGLGVGAVVTYVDMENQNIRQDERIAVMEQQITKMSESLSVFYEFYRHNECSLLTKERETDDYADLTYKQLCITGIFK